MAARSPSSRGGSGCPSRRGGDYYHFEEYVMIDNAQEPCLASLRWLGRLPDLFRHQLVAGILPNKYLHFINLIFTLLYFYFYSPIYQSCLYSLLTPPGCWQSRHLHCDDP